MSSSDSAAQSQMHCKKQLAPLLSSDSSLSSNSSSNNNIVTSVTAYNVSKTSISACPPEKSTTRLPNVSKHIRHKLHTAKKTTYTVVVPNTSKSMPVQTKLGNYFKSIATMTTKQNPSLRPMQYKKSQAMFKLGAQISRSNIGLIHKPSSHQRSSPIPEQSSSSNHPSDPLVAESSSMEAFWSHSPTSISTSKREEMILKKDECPSYASTCSRGSYFSMTNTSKSQNFHTRSSKESEFFPSAPIRSLSNPKPPLHTRSHYGAHQSSSHDASISSVEHSNVESDESSAKSALLKLPVLNDVRSDAESSFTSSRKDFDRLPPPSRKIHENKSSSRKENVKTSRTSLSPSLSSSLVSSISEAHRDLDLQKSFSHIPPKEISRVQMLLKEIISDTSTIQSLRSEFEARKQLIESKLEEITMSDKCSDISKYTIPFHQSIASDAGTEIPIPSPIHSLATRLSSIETPRCHKFTNLNFHGNKDDPTYTIPLSYTAIITIGL